MFSKRAVVQPTVSFTFVSASHCVLISYLDTRLEDGAALPSLRIEIVVEVAQSQARRMPGVKRVLKEMENIFKYMEVLKCLGNWANHNCLDNLVRDCLASSTLYLVHNQLSLSSHPKVRA